MNRFYAAANTVLISSDAMIDKMSTSPRGSTSVAGPGEVLVTDATARAAGFDAGGLQRRELSLRGRVEPLPVTVVTTGQERLWP